MRKLPWSSFISFCYHQHNTFLSSCRLSFVFTFFQFSFFSSNPRFPFSASRSSFPRFLPASSFFLSHSRFSFLILPTCPLILPKCPSLKLQDYQNAPQKGKMVISTDINFLLWFSRWWVNRALVKKKIDMPSFEFTSFQYVRDDKIQNSKLYI